ncbi:hypothetical protein JTB14_018342 [Gonioctena quinquepunctata]|nr:hypothetical protein JTB14_018342 [Gonioctena quinquepunctata]
MKGGIIRIVGDRPNDNAQWLIKIIPGDNSKKCDMLLGKYSTNFTIFLEVVPSENMVKGATVAFDNIWLSQCYYKNDSCMVNQYKCTQTCINILSICDITNDCPEGDDEQQSCDNRYPQRASGILRLKMQSGADFQLDRIQLADTMMTEYNPLYEFGGIVYTLKDLNDLPRNQLRLSKAIGQGAFGEVFEGFYRQRPYDTVEMLVAVNTLQEMSISQAEMDFLMEALIMSKLKHPNIVHFIGVCFDKHPRYIVLELLTGGDLKNFLRESRPKPEKPSLLTRKDLVMIAIDVAEGCKYLEEHRFIHRDIAARNSLLTTKGPGRCAKISDFGMSRDVYRCDYYRKDGKAMLPIKWMPPEAFQDGVFTTKTDDVMDLVLSVGRLDPPSNCPVALLL